MDWQVKVNHGRPQFGVCQDSSVACLHLKSAAASYGLEHKVDVQPSRLPYLTWRWKVTRLPAGGDFRHATTDDQAAQILVAFDDNRVLTYIWDSTAPKGTAAPAQSFPFVRIFAVVCESGDASANQWLSETRNIADDFQRAFGRPAPRVKGLRLQINSQHTGTLAESYFGEVAFRSTPE
ncbi:MAG TPA: DUF3047 domain-containing protein [Bryobacteraceae bacterium]|nr:DUF3047 domain-containing protein [Bryobacteraceae bacterium]